MANQLEIKEVLSWTIPTYGNKHSSPYGSLLVSDGILTKTVQTQEDLNGTYINFNRKRYQVENKGSLYSPKLTLKSEEQTLGDKLSSTKSRAECLEEISQIVKSENLMQGESIGYTMPDGKHHIFIYQDQEDRWDDGPPEKFFVIEPNRVEDGGHEPMGDTYLTNSLDLSEVLSGCQWCFDLFNSDREVEQSHKNKSSSLDSMIANAAGRTSTSTTTPGKEPDKGIG